MKDEKPLARVDSPSASTDSPTASANEVTPAPAHTPGPWVFRHNSDSQGDGVRRIVAPETQFAKTLMCDERYYPWCPDDDADWRLIAAAPELLAALKALKAEVIESGNWYARDFGWPDVKSAVEAAIAKAEGR